MVRTQTLLVLLLCSAAHTASSLSVSEGWPWSRKAKTTEAPKAEAQEVTTTVRAMLKTPSLPGCYMRMLTGCPKKPMRTFLWRRDTWADEHNLDKEGCEKRKSVWDTYCDARDAEMVFVPGPAPASQEEPAAASEAAPANETVASEGGEAANTTVAGEAAAAADGQTVSNGTASEPLSALQISSEWSWPWSKRRRDADEKKVEVEAKQAEAEAETTQAPAASEEVAVQDPSQPGCYMRMPSGCPKKPMKTQLWRHDTWAEQHDLDKEGCEKRKSVWDGYCESQDAKMAFVPKQ